MKFEDAMNRVYDDMEKKDPNIFKIDGIFKDTREAHVATVIWNMIAIAQEEKGLDDFVIVRNNNIISFPFEEKADEGSDEDEKTKKGTGKSPKPATATKDKVDVKEKAEKTEPDPE
jgi:hypothetical protein